MTHTGRLLFTLTLVAALPCHAATIHVPADYSTIQDGVDAAASGDTVLVGPGTYHDCTHSDADGTLNCVILDKSIVLRSESGPGVTIIDAQGIGRVISCPDNATQTELSGFTLTGGSASSGGGVFAAVGTTVCDVVVSWNTASFGGGLYAVGSGVLVENALFRGNTANGGAAVGTFLGGGTYDGCIITGNLGLDAGSGAFEVASGVDAPGIANSLIANNTCSGFRSAADERGGLLLESSTIAGNSEPQLSFPWGDFERVVCTGNLDCTGSNLDALSLLHSDILGTIDGSFFTVWQTPNLNADPLFCAPSSDDFTLAANSPCLPQNNPWGVLVGALGQGCSATSAVVVELEERSWGTIKGTYR